MSLTVLVFVEKVEKSKNTWKILFQVTNMVSAVLWIIDQLVFYEFIAILEGNVFYSHVALCLKVAHHGNHTNIKRIFDYLQTLYWKYFEKLLNTTFKYGDSESGVLI